MKQTTKRDIWGLPDSTLNLPHRVQPPAAISHAPVTDVLFDIQVNFIGLEAIEFTQGGKVVQSVPTTMPKIADDIIFLESP